MAGERKHTDLVKSTLSTRVLPLAAVVALAACNDAPLDPRGVERDETLLSVSASGEADTRPDQARFEAGINSWGANARAATEANNADIRKIVAALKAAGVAEKDIQTRNVSVQLVDWGARKGQYQASNILAVTVREVGRTGDVVTAVTSAGANIVSGPDLRMADPEKAANSAYRAAYLAARSRAETYANAAGMEIARIISIRDMGGAQGNRYLAGAVPVAPPPVVQAVAAEEGRGSSIVLPGQTASSVSVQVDFALVPK